MNAKFTRLYEMARRGLTQNLLPWWMEYTVDREHGGFYGQVDHRNRPVPGAAKFITLNARLIWTFSSALRVLGDPGYREMADRAYGYFMEYFWDGEYGGAFTTLDAEGRVLDDHKFIYGNAFALYGLSEYARATGSREALGYARAVFDCLEKYVYDPVHKGYYESCDRNWQVNPRIRGVNRVPSDVKTMNTHLHLIEAYTGLLRVEDVPAVRAKVREHLDVMLNRIVNRDIHHYHYYQARDWTPTSTAVSFGHDIEGSWLMTETADVLGEPEATRAARDPCVSMARAVLEEGLRADGALLTEYDPATGEWADRLSWWEQNEAVVGFINAWELTGEESFLDAALQCFAYIEGHFIDRKGGGWHPVLTLAGEPIRSVNKCDGPICPYHNGRMSLEIIERYGRHEAAESNKE